MMISLDNYCLSIDEREALESLLAQVGHDMSLKDLYRMMDEIWFSYGCESSCYDEKKYAQFYSHPIWLLNGIFVEQHRESRANRVAIAEALRLTESKTILDFGGGFGTLARLITELMPESRIDIWDPFPPRHGIEVCKSIPNIQFISSPQDESYDALTCTDVLEHVHDPLLLLADMIAKVKLGGTLVIYNCFYPLIQCHLPCTFHFIRTFDEFCAMLGLDVVGKTSDDHATIYQKVYSVVPDWALLRKLEAQSRLSYRMECWRKANSGASSLRYKLELARASPLYYPEKCMTKLINVFRNS